jgi:hypothetical protein
LKDRGITPLGNALLKRSREALKKRRKLEAFQFGSDEQGFRKTNCCKVNSTGA